MRRTLRHIITGLLLSAAAIAAEPTGVIVEMSPPQIQRHSFDPANPPAEMPKLNPAEVGTCVYQIGCATDLHAAGTRVVLGRNPAARVSSIKIKGHLRVTIWTPINCPPKILAHEEAHRAICERYYRPASEIARRIGAAVLGRSLNVPISDDQGVATAMKQIQDSVVAEFMTATMTRCEIAQERFDAITQHSINPIGASEAMARAIAEESAQGPTRPRSTPQRPAFNPDGYRGKTEVRNYGAQTG
jgi:hypothetical protein